MKWFRDAMIGLMCVAFACCALNLVKLVQKMEYDLNVISSQAYYVANGVHDVTDQLQNTIKTANTTLLEVRAASEDERVALGKQNQRVLDVLEQTETALVNLQIAVDDVDKNTGKVSQASVDAVNDLKPLLVEATISIKSAGILFSDPHLTQTATNLDTTTKNMAATTANLEHTTKQIDQKVQELLKPASLIKRIATTTLDFVAKIGNIKQVFQ